MENWLTISSLTIVFIFLSGSVASLSTECTDNAATEQQVADTFFKPYGNWQRPRLNPSDVVNVNLTFVLSAIDDVIEKERKVEITGYISVRWMDEFRVWKDKSPYNCVEYVVVPSTEVWLPDIAQMNANRRYALMTMKGEKVRIYNNGYAIFSPGGTFSAFCDFDITMFPFDIQTCAIKLESWRYTMAHVKFNFGSNITIRYWSDNEQWDLISYSQSLFDYTYLDAANSFSHVEFYITIKRKVVYYMMNVLVPSALIMVAHLATFALPDGVVEKLEISFTCLLAYGIFQLMVINDLPRSSTNIPLLSVYIALQMAYITFSMLGEALCYILLSQIEEQSSYGESEKWVPSWLLKLASRFGRMVCIGQPPSERPEKNNRGNDRLASPSTISKMHQSDQSDDTNESRNNNAEHGSGAEAGEGHIRPIMQEAWNPGHRDRTQRRLSNGVQHRHDELVPSSLNRRQLQWRYLAHVVNRIVFVIYLVAIIVTPCGMFAYAKYKRTHYSN